MRSGSKAQAACAQWLESAKWPKGFACSRCGEAKREPYRFEARPGILRCKSCRRDISLTAGSVMERTHTPLTAWFWGAYLVSSLTPGLSAVQFQRQLGLSRYETAFQILHKLRAGMVRPGRDRIGGNLARRDHVEIDETWVGGKTRGEGRGTHDMTLVIGAVEVRQRPPKKGDKPERRGGRYAGRLRLAAPPQHGASVGLGDAGDRPAPVARELRQQKNRRHRPWGAIARRRASRPHRARRRHRRG